MARVSDFFSEESKSDFFLFEGVKVKEDWLVQVNLFYIESKSKKNIFFCCCCFVCGGGAK